MKQGFFGLNFNTLAFLKKIILRVRNSPYAFCFWYS